MSLIGASGVRPESTVILQGTVTMKSARSVSADVVSHYVKLQVANVFHSYLRIEIEHSVRLADETVVYDPEKRSRWGVCLRTLRDSLSINNGSSSLWQSEKALRILQDLASCVGPADEVHFGVIDVDELVSRTVALRPLSFV